MRSVVGIACLAVMFLVLLPSALHADTLHLKNGASYEGKVLSESGGKVKFQTSTGMTVTFDRSEVDRIEKGRTRLDDYADRLAALAADDIAGHFELADWCADNKLYSQKKKVLARIRKVCPDHPGLRRERNQIWQDGKWVKAPKDMRPLTVTGAEKKAVPEAGASVAVPRGWKASHEANRATAIGPDRYKVPPVLTVAFGAPHGDIATSFPEKDGWSKPTEVSAGGMTGHRIRRTVTEKLIDRAEVLVLLSGRKRGVRISLTCLRMQERLFTKAVEIALRTLEFEVPKADYVNKHYGYALDLPKPAGEWEAIEDEEKDLEIVHKQLDVTDWGRFWVITGQGEKEIDQVQKHFDGKRSVLLEYGGKEKQIDFCGEKATFVDGTYLDEGIPCRLRILLVRHGKRLYLLTFDQHEHGQKKTNHCWDTVIDSFRFLK